MNKLKITAGLGTVDDFEAFVLAGADEVFAGVVPMEWMETAGAYRPLNRREVLSSNVQIGSMAELMILKKRQEKHPIPVSITLNSPYYEPALYPLVKKAMEKILEIGFDRFIIADLDYLEYLTSDPQLLKRIHWQISGEIGQINPPLMRRLEELGAERVIFHRQVRIDDMKALIGGADPAVEYEAFVLNERCEFCGGYCFTLHVDEMPPMCRVEYRLMTASGALQRERDPMKAAKCLETEDSIPERDVNHGGLLGEGGCGLCALWKLRDAGITHLKLVSRGNYFEDTLRDIRALRRARQILEESRSETEYTAKMKQELFPEGCSENCYYF